MVERAEVPDDIVTKVRSVCTALPEVDEDAAWTGVRWSVRTRTFAHVLGIEAGWPPAYARAAATDGPAIVLMFRSSGPELDALRQGGHPYFAPMWRRDEVGMPARRLADPSEKPRVALRKACLSVARGPVLMRRHDRIDVLQQVQDLHP